MDAAMKRIWAFSFLQDYLVNAGGILWNYTGPVDIDLLLSPLTEDDLARLQRHLPATSACH